MASSEAKPVNISDLEEICTCWVCFETFVEPITLHCGHTLCKDCLIAVYKKSAVCPFCRHPFGVPLPPVNKSIVDLVERLKRAKAGVAVDVAEADLDAARKLPQRQDSVLVNLPPEVLRHILCQCDAKTLGKVSLTCRSMRDKVGDQLLWREMCRNRWPFVSIDRYKSWKTCYIANATILRGWDEGTPGEFHVSTFRGHKGYITDFQLYRSILVTASSDHNACIWRANQSAVKSDTSFSSSDGPLHVLAGHEDTVNCVKFDEASVVTGGADNTARFWDMTTGTQTALYRTTAPVCTLCRADNILYQGSTNGIIKMWDCKTGVCERIITDATSPIRGIWATENEMYSFSEDAVRIYDTRAGQLAHIPQESQAFYVDPTKSEITLALDRGTVDVWDTKSCCVKRSYNTGSRAKLTTLACDGTHVAAGNEEGTVTVWNAATSDVLYSFTDHRGRINAIQMDDRKVVSASADNSIKVWNLKTGARQFTLLGGSLAVRANVPEHPTLRGVCMMHFDESRIVASMKNLVRVYDFEVLPETAMV